MMAPPLAVQPPALSLVERVHGAYLRRVGVRRWPKRISAMLRVKDEEEFLDAAVRSIVDLVEQVVIVDNASRDATPQIIAALRAAYPDKIAVHHYPHAVARVGRETAELWRRHGDAAPQLSGAFYFWCLRRCREPYVLKWDGDMIATPALGEALADWRRSPLPVLRLQGANVYRDRRHLAASRCGDRDALRARHRGLGVPIWVSDLRRDALEPRLFPRAGARYDHRIGITQVLVSPFCDRRFGPDRSARVDGAYLHLKFCKRDPYANYSDDLARLIEDNLTVGPPLDDEAVRLLARWGLDVPVARRA